MSIKLTKKQALVYNYIKDFITENNYSPSYRDICAGLSLSSPATAAEHVNNLIALGALRKTPETARSLEVVDITFPETTELFRTKMAQITDEEDLEILRKAAIILDIDLTEGI